MDLLCGDDRGKMTHGRVKSYMNLETSRFRVCVKLGSQAIAGWKRGRSTGGEFWKPRLHPLSEQFSFTLAKHVEDAAGRPFSGSVVGDVYSGNFSAGTLVHVSALENPAQEKAHSLE